MSLILSNSYGKSHLVHLIDTPGHVNFVDEVASAIRLVDGILLVVDVVEGVSTHPPAVPLLLSALVVGDVQHGSDYPTCAPRRCQNHSCCQQD